MITYTIVVIETQLSKSALVKKIQIQIRLPPPKKIMTQPKSLKI